MEESKTEEILFVSVKEEPLDEDCLAEGPSLKEELLKHEETEITDMQVDEEENNEQIPETVEPNISNVLIKTRESCEVITDEPIFTPQVVIKEEAEDSFEEDGDENETFTHACDKCSKAFKNETNLRRHQKSVHNMVFSCIICNEWFVTAKDVNQHSQSLHNLSCCEYCLEKMGRYSCSFKGKPCTHDINVTEPTDPDELNSA